MHGFAKRAHQEIDFRHAALFFGTAQTTLATHTDGMRFIHIQSHVGKFALKSDQLLQIGDVAIHAEHRFGDDDDAFKRGMVLAQQGVQVRHVVVAIAQKRGLADEQTIHHAGMHQFVGQYQHLARRQSV